jgi:hypothetical protein
LNADLIQEVVPNLTKNSIAAIRNTHPMLATERDITRTMSNENEEILFSEQRPPLFSSITLRQWYTSTMLPLIDLRQRSLCEVFPLHSSERKIINIPFSDIQSGLRSCELPPRHLEFAILYSEDECENQQLDAIRKLFGATVSEATQQSRQPWNVQFVIKADDLFKHECEELGLHQGNDKLFPLPRLFSPDSMVEHYLLPKVIKTYDEIRAFNKEIQFCIYDLGSGAGRDMAFLSEELLSFHNQNYSAYNANIRCIGIDNHKGSSRRCVPLWERRGVGSITESLHLNLKNLDELNIILKQSVPNCIYAVRYLNRPLLCYLAKILPHGTIFAMSHFCKTKPFQDWNFDHPRANSVLERHELRTVFESWCIEHDDIVLDSDHGRTLINFIAVRK